jgi:signal transduction histidine kinase/ligand-binding sensor domain-containing protein
MMLPTFFTVSRTARRRLFATFFVLFGCGIVQSAAARAQHSAASRPATQSIIPSPENAVFEHITANDGLPQNSVNSIVQDKRGFIWFATQDGLCRYDGSQIKVFRPKSGAPRALQAGFIFRLFADSRGEIWAATTGGGLAKYNSVSADFTIYRRDPSNPKSLPGDNVNDIAEDNEGYLWIALAEEGIARLNPATGEAESIVLPSLSAQSSNNARAGEARSLAVDKFGNVWVGVFGGGLHCFEPKTKRWTSLRVEARNPEALPSDQMWYMTIDSFGALWVATRNAGIAVVNVETRRVMARYCHRAGDESSLANDNVWGVYEDDDKNLWIATFGGGLCRFDRTTQSFRAYRSRPGCATSLQSNVVLSVFRDREQNLWVGMQFAGVAKFDPSAQRFASFRETSACVGGVLTHGVIRSIFEDARGRLWVGTNKFGVNILETVAGNVKTTVLRHDSLDKQSIAGDAVWSITDDANGNIWVASGGGGATVLNSQTLKAVKTYRHNPANPRSLGSNTLRVVMRDSQGRFWLGAFLGGLHRFNPATDDFTRYEPDAANPQSIQSAEVRAIVEDVSEGKPNGKLWVGTWGGGLSYFDPETESFTTFRHREADSATLASDVIRSLLVARDGTMWVGTNGGLCRFDRKKRTFTTFREEQGLPNNVIYAVQEDADGRLWISTNKGIARFEPATGRVRSYSVADGLPDNEFNGNVSHKGADGTLYFGSIQGVAIVRPWLLRDEPPSPRVALTAFKIFNRPAVLDTVIEERSSLKVAYSDNFLTFGFAALAYSGAKAIEYRYILEGFDQDWVESGAKREAIYTNLNPGEYLLRVQARRGGGEWDASVEARLRLTVVPPWWMTLWFRSLAAAFALAVAGGAVWGRLMILRRRAEYLAEEVKRSTRELREANTEISRQLEIQTEQAREIELTNTLLQELNERLESQNQRLEDLNTEKNELMGIVSHDLKNSIGAVRTFGELIHNQSFVGEEALEAAGHIVATSDRMLELVKNLLDVNRLESGAMQLYRVEVDIAPIVGSVAAQYAERAALKSIQIGFSCEAERSVVFVDEQAFMQVMDNLVSNAVKYSPHGKNVFVRVKSSDNAVRVEVEDEGPGISEEDMKKLFGKFARLSARPTGGEHSTGLGLSIVKKMVEAMNGAVWCESELGKGAKFIVELPRFFVS